MRPPAMDFDKEVMLLRMLTFSRFIGAALNLFLIILGVMVFVEGPDDSDFYSTCTLIGDGLGFIGAGLVGILYECYYGPTTILSYIFTFLYYFLMGCLAMGEATSTSSTGSAWEVCCTIVGGFSWSIAVIRLALSFTAKNWMEHDDESTRLVDTGRQNQPLFSPPPGGWNTNIGTLPTMSGFTSTEHT